MKRLYFTLCTFWMLAFQLSADPSGKPNLLFIIADQHRGDFMHCAGHPLVQTPSLDKLASQGVRFERAYTSWPICVPARMSARLDARRSVRPQ